MTSCRSGERGAAHPEVLRSDRFAVTTGNAPAGTTMAQTTTESLEASRA
jgi:hypothetical protein